MLTKSMMISDEGSSEYHGECGPGYLLKRERKRCRDSFYSCRLSHKLAEAEDGLKRRLGVASAAFKALYICVRNGSSAFDLLCLALMQ